MPAGCNFMCNNEQCEQYRSGFTINGIWPIGNIDDVVKQNKVNINEPFRDKLLELKEEGREHTCICFPNDEEVAYVGYRVQKWCPNCTSINSYDVMIDEDTVDAESAIDKADIQSLCGKCKELMQDFEYVVAEGIGCPFCHEKMEQNRWFSNVKSAPPNITIAG